MIKITYGLSIALLSTSVVVVQSQRAVASIPDPVREIAEKVTVRIDGAGKGTGIIIDRAGNTYTVLTCWHVVGKPNTHTLNQGTYMLRTGDGKTYTVEGSAVTKVADIDLAELKFTSNENYTPVEIGNSSKLIAGSTVYAFGWAAPDEVSKEWQYRPVETTATVVAKPVDEYALVLNNPIKPGMSGGPILDEQGRLIGINGEARTDVRTDTEDFLGIPIDTYNKVASRQNSNQKPAPEVSGSTATTKDAEEFVREGNDKFDKSDYQGAIALYNQAIRLNPNDAKSYYKRGRARYDLGDYQGAIADFTQVIKINPNYADAYYSRGSARYQLGDKQGATDDYNQAIQINPTLP